MLANTRDKEIKTMTKMEMVKKIEELQELETFMEEIKAEVDTIKDSLKNEMLERDTEELTAGTIVTMIS